MKMKTGVGIHFPRISARHNLSFVEVFFCDVFFAQKQIQFVFENVALIQRGEIREKLCLEIMRK